MIVFLNGKFVAEEDAVISVFDRGFLYGDGLFEAMLVNEGEPFAWDEHMERLARGLDVLKIKIPYSLEQLREFALELIARNKMPRAILRISLSRGLTGRGYSPRGAVNPGVVISLHPAPPADPTMMPRWRIVISSYRILSDDPLARFKTANKLPQIMARSEADAADAHEALLLNSDGFVAEGTTSNLFWIEAGTVCTPPLPQGALPGITRRLTLELCVKTKIPHREKKARSADLRRAEGAFLTMTSMGLVEIESIDGQKMKRSPLVKKLWRDYGRLV